MYSSFEAREEIEEHLGGWRTQADNFLQFAPYAGLAILSTFNIQLHDDRVNTLLLIAKSEAIMLASVHITKRLTNIDRPNGQAYAFPSGHTAQAFLAASIVHTELRDKSPWYGIGAYTVATSVGVLRMINNKHWEADVLAGAGIGIFSAHLTYLTHSYRWGRKPLLVGLNVAPAYFGGGTPGLTLSWRPVADRHY
ncbi:phosphatase PAP2 family protein [Hymenobacter lucidus]|uniref:Phosphatase PAP2 family protein n=1 Tax=Hymenobacter lucidus TaxID=2880930 RepID=A0ABS8AY09_9BACT|nr:phosphatase PAP2 family protein [Hymenobacter lucidus]MCB2410709.1 phosphatase PAP2 family protein [Hymenobacter lucidus]